MPLFSQRIPKIQNKRPSKSSGTYRTGKFACPAVIHDEFRFVLQDLVGVGLIQPHLDQTRLALIIPFQECVLGASIQHGWWHPLQGLKSSGMSGSRGASSNRARKRRRGPYAGCRNRLFSPMTTQPCQRRLHPSERCPRVPHRYGQSLRIDLQVGFQPGHHRSLDRHQFPVPRRTAWYRNPTNPMPAFQADAGSQRPGPNGLPSNHPR